MSLTNRRAPAKARRTPVTITVTEETNQGLILIGGGNRSLAIELLVRDHLAKRPRPKLEPVKP